MAGEQVRPATTQRQASRPGVPGRALRPVRTAGRFWYDFVIGDDWLIAAGVALALAATYVLSEARVAAWWLVPVAVTVLLPISLRRLIRRR